MNTQLQILKVRNLLLEVWLRTRKGITEHAGGHKRDEPTCVGLGLMCHKDHEWAGLKQTSRLLEAFLGKGLQGLQ